MYFSVFAKVCELATSLFIAEFIVSVPSLFAYTASAPSLRSVGLVWEWMAPLAMRLACVDCCWCIRSDGVFSFGDKFEMAWVDTNRISANNMVNTPLTVLGTCRDWSFGPREQYPVDEMLDATICYSSAVLAFCASPYPATRFWVHLDFGEYALVFALGKLNREILDLIHAVYSFAVDGVVRADAVCQHCFGSFSILKTMVQVNTPSWFWIKE